MIRKNLSFMIPINPVTKKNSQKIITNRTTHRPMIIPSPDYTRYEKDCGFFVKVPEKPIEHPVNVKCLFFRDSERRVDLTNLLEAIDDILVKYEVLKDDSFKYIYGHDGSRVYIDRENPRTEVYISWLEEGGQNDERTGSR